MNNAVLRLRMRRTSPAKRQTMLALSPEMARSSMAVLRPQSVVRDQIDQADRAIGDLVVNKSTPTNQVMAIAESRRNSRGEIRDACQRGTCGIERSRVGNQQASPNVDDKVRPESMQIRHNRNCVVMGFG
jgi:hypothetical protein